eukprot:NODE_375_length_9841_cov_0.151098.p3 type:complete len:270 gc:universal NODE_375_length_9841_cov_0.151098:8713-9522(+)
MVALNDMGAIITISTLSLIQLILGVIYSMNVMRKKGTIFWLCVSCLACCSLHILFMIIPDNGGLDCVSATISELTLFLLYSLYLERIKSLGHVRVKYDSLIFFVPITVVTIHIGPSAAYILASLEPKYRELFRVLNCIVSLLLLFSESYCFAILIKKMTLMMELRNTLKKVLVKQIVTAYCITILGDVTIVVLNFYDPFFGVSLRYVMISFKVLFVIDYYRYVVAEMNRGSDSGMILQLLDEQHVEQEPAAFGKEDPSYHHHFDQQINL